MAINGPFSMAMLNNQRVILIYIYIIMIQLLIISNHVNLISNIEPGYCMSIHVVRQPTSRFRMLIS
jgi:hypothetical protein